MQYFLWRTHYMYIFYRFDRDPLLSPRLTDIDTPLADIDTPAAAKSSVTESYPIFLDVGEVFDIKSYVDVYCKHPSAKYEGVVCSFPSWCVEGQCHNMLELKTQ